MVKLKLYFPAGLTAPPIPAGKLVGRPRIFKANILIELFVEHFSVIVVYGIVEKSRIWNAVA